MVITKQMRDDGEYAVFTPDGVKVTIGHDFNAATESLAMLVGKPERTLTSISPDGATKTHISLGAKAEYQWIKVPGFYAMHRGQRVGKAN